MTDKTEFSKKIGEHIRKQREAKGYSGAELAKIIEMDRPNLHKLETGGYSPSLLIISQVAKGLDMSLSELLEDFEY